MRGPDAHEVATMLVGDIDRLVRQILPDARQEGSELRGHGPDGGVWSVVTRGRKTGVFCNWSDRERQRGDLLELIRWGVCGGDRPAAYAWALSFLGMSANALPRDPEAEAARKRKMAEDAARRQAVAQTDAAERKRRALGRYLDSVREIAGTPVEMYLLARGLPLAGFRRRGASLRHPLRSLRFAPSCFHSYSDGEARRAVMFPAMLAPIVNPMTGEIGGVHQTYLAPRHDQTSEWTKAPIKPAKQSFGQKSGGVIPLLRGASNKALKDAPDGDLLLIAEGIENALSGALAYPEARCFAGVDIGNLAQIGLPRAFSRIILVSDRDGFNPASDAARERVLDRWAGEGRDVDLMLPPAGFKDVNDYLRGRSAAVMAEAVA